MTGMTVSLRRSRAGGAARSAPKARRAAASSTRGPRLDPETGAGWQEVTAPGPSTTARDRRSPSRSGSAWPPPSTTTRWPRLEAVLPRARRRSEHEVSPLALGDALAVLSSRGYEPFELTSVMFQPIAGARRCADAWRPASTVRVDRRRRGRRLGGGRGRRVERYAGGRAVRPRHRQVYAHMAKAPVLPGRARRRRRPPPACWRSTTAWRCWPGRARGRHIAGRARSWRCSAPGWPRRDGAAATWR